MRKGIALAHLICLILAKNNSKLLKLQLFNYFGQYLSIGTTFWNLKFRTHFEFPIITWNHSNVLISCVFSWLWFFLEIRIMCANIYFNWLKSKINQTLRSCRLTLELEFCFIFIPIFRNEFKTLSDYHDNLCIESLFHFHSLYVIFISSGILIALFSLSLHLYIKSSRKNLILQNNLLL